MDIIEKKETVKAAIKFLQKKKKDILDEVRYLEKIAPLYYRNNQKGKAIESMNEVLSINPYNE